VKVANQNYVACAFALGEQQLLPILRPRKIKNLSRTKIRDPSRLTTCQPLFPNIDGTRSITTPTSFVKEQSSLFPEESYQLTFKLERLVRGELSLLDPHELVWRKSVVLQIPQPSPRAVSGVAGCGDS
jgi:hypothetical protein